MNDWDARQEIKSQISNSTWSHVTEAQLNLLDTAIEYTKRQDIPSKLLHDPVMRSLLNEIGLAYYLARHTIDEQAPNFVVSSSRHEEFRGLFLTLCLHITHFGLVEFTRLEINVKRCGCESCSV